MTPSEALEPLSVHSGSLADESDLRSERGFLGQLHPFTGELDEAPFHEIMLALRVLRPVVGEDAETGMQIAAELHAILVLARINAIDPGCPIRRDRYISDGQVATLERWLGLIGWTWLRILQDASEESAFMAYTEYKNG